MENLTLTERRHKSPILASKAGHQKVFLIPRQNDEQFSVKISVYVATKNHTSLNLCFNLYFWRLEFYSDIWNKKR
jgi:hypothetical protein